VTNRVATVLVARNNLFREGLLLILRTTAFRVCKVAPTIDDLSLRSTRTSRPFLFLIGTGGDHAVTVPTVERLRKQNPSARIVVLSDRCELNDALAVFRAGADGYLFERVSRDALIKSLNLVMLGGTILPATLMRLVGEDHEMDSEDDPAVPAAQTEVPTFDHMPRTLSQREMGILRRLMEGEPNKIIARQFDITEATVKVHIKAILRKINVRNRTQAAVWAQSHLRKARSSVNRLASGSSVTTLAGKLVAAADSFANYGLLEFFAF
jgi:two-component system, NarL family, nitrate/nitrite response regulator NarL